jgi:putative transport protein
MQLVSSPVFLLFAILLCGEVVGRIRFRSFSLGTTAILIVALGFGYYGQVLPQLVQTLGLTLFIYSIGLQAGPGFVSSLRATGLRLSLGAAAVVFLGFVTCLGVCLLLGYGPGMGAGILAGALTSTPGLAAAIELTGDPATASAYGVTYLFGVVGVVLCIKLLPAILRVNVQREEAAVRAEAVTGHPPLAVHHLVVNNPNVFGKSVRTLALRDVAAVTLTRIQPSGASSATLVTADTILEEGDRVRVVGTERDLEKVHLLVGRRTDEEILFSEDLAARAIIVSSKKVVGKRLASLNLIEVFNVRISRIHRNGFDLTPSPEMRIRQGDVATVVGHQSSVANVGKLFGDDLESTYAADVFALVAGILVGFVVGRIPIPVPVVGEIRLGVTGGVLIAGIVLGGLYNTGRVIWALPGPANQLLRQLGLMFFLAAVGTGAGATIVPTLRSHGAALLFSGIVVTVVPLVGGVLLCRRALGLHLFHTLGVISGGMTSTPGLAAAATLSTGHAASAAYATVYPTALVTMIICSKLLVGLLG